MRKKFSILMEEDKPIGGKWNFDSDNPKTLERKPKYNRGLQAHLTIMRSYF